jgi:DtxR family Mn-dependent transcriptional regulator
MEHREELTESQEDYLETIYRIILKKDVARVKEIAAELKVRYPSVTSALQTLEKRGLVNYEPYGTITLTKEGFDAAIEVTGRHRLLKSFFSKVLGIEALKAEESACRIEHVISSEVYTRLVQFVKYVYTTQDSADKWLEDFKKFAKKDKASHTGGAGIDTYFKGTGFALEGENHED